MPSPETSRQNLAKGRDKAIARARERTALNIPNGENNEILKHVMALTDYVMTEGVVDKTNPLDVEARCRKFIEICAENDEKPTVAGLALFLGIDRQTLVAWHNHEVRLPSQTQLVIDTYYNLLTAHMEQLMENGKINPIPGIFLMKNNMGYRDQNEVKVTTDGMGELVERKDLQTKYRNIVEVEAIDITDDIE